MMESRSPGKMALRRFLKNPRAVVCAALLLLLATATFVVPWISAHDYTEQDFDYMGGGPNGTYWFGSDVLGRASGEGFGVVLCFAV